MTKITVWWPPMTYRIEFTRFYPESADTQGYFARDYLPGYPNDVTFQTRTEAECYIEDNHTGPDEDGVTACFRIVEMTEPDAINTQRRRI